MMRAKENTQAVELITDFVMVIACLGTLFLYLQFGSEVREGLGLMLTGLVEDLNNSLAH